MDSVHTRAQAQVHYTRTHTHTQSNDCSTDSLSSVHRFESIAILVVPADLALRTQTGKPNLLWNGRSVESSLPTTERALSSHFAQHNQSVVLSHPNDRLHYEFHSDPKRNTNLTFFFYLSLFVGSIESEWATVVGRLMFIWSELNKCQIS